MLLILENGLINSIMCPIVGFISSLDAKANEVLLKATLI